MIDYLYSRALGTTASIALTAAILISVTGLSVSIETDSVKGVATGLARLIDEAGRPESGSVRIDFSIGQISADKGIRIHLHRSSLIAENDRASFTKGLGTEILIHHDGLAVDRTTCSYDSVLRIETACPDGSTRSKTVSVFVSSAPYFSSVISASAPANMSASESVL